LVEEGNRVVQIVVFLGNFLLDTLNQVQVFAVLVYQGVLTSRAHAAGANSFHFFLFIGSEPPFRLRLEGPGNFFLLFYWFAE